MKCKEVNCKTQAYFNLPNEKTGIYCKKHKKDGMMDVNNKRCKELNCNKIPSFNFPNTKIRIYCKEHKKVGMINTPS